MDMQQLGQATWPLIYSVETDEVGQEMAATADQKKRDPLVKVQGKLHLLIQFQIREKESNAAGMARDGFARCMKSKE